MQKTDDSFITYFTEYAYNMNNESTDILSLAKLHGIFVQLIYSPLLLILN